MGFLLIDLNLSGYTYCTDKMDSEMVDRNRHIE